MSTEDKNKYKKTTIILKKEILEILNEKKEKEGINLTYTINKALEEYLEKANK